MSRVKYTAETKRAIDKAWYAVAGLQQCRYERDTLAGCMHLHDRSNEIEWRKANLLDSFLDGQTKRVVEVADLKIASFRLIPWIQSAEFRKKVVSEWKQTARQTIKSARNERHASDIKRAKQRMRDYRAALVLARQAVELEKRDRYASHEAALKVLRANR